MDGSQSEKVRGNFIGLRDMHMAGRKERWQRMATLEDGINSRSEERRVGKEC